LRIVGKSFCSGPSQDYSGACIRKAPFRDPHSAPDFCGRNRFGPPPKRGERDRAAVIEKSGLAEGAESAAATGQSELGDYGDTPVNSLYRPSAETGFIGGDEGRRTVPPPSPPPAPTRAQNGA